MLRWQVGRIRLPQPVQEESPEGGSPPESSPELEIICATNDWEPFWVAEGYLYLRSRETIDVEVTDAKPEPPTCNSCKHYGGYFCRLSRCSLHRKTPGCEKHERK